MTPDELTALRELRTGVATWWIQINDTINCVGRPDLTALAGVGEELTRQCWAIRNQAPESLVHRVERVRTERQATIAQRATT
jgi:hypothetical protein